MGCDYKSHRFSQRYFLEEIFCWLNDISCCHSDLQKRDAVERVYQRAIRYRVDA
mgnify:CR=1 FL=1